MKEFIELMKSKLDKLFKTGFFHVFGSNVINKVITFFSSIILVRLLTKAEYGIFTYAWNIYSIILIFNGLGLVNGILQLCSEKVGDSEYCRAIVKYGTHIGLWADAALAGIVILLSVFFPIKIAGASELLFMLCMLPFISFVYDVIMAYLRSVKDNKNYSRLSVLNTALYAVLSVAGAFLYKEKGLILGHYLASAITVICGLSVIKIGSLCRTREVVTVEDKKSTLKISVVSMMNNGISQLLYLLDVFVLGIVAADETILASYKVATTIPSALTFIPLSFVIYIYPYFAEHKDDGKWCIKHYRKLVAAMGGFNFVLAAVLIVLAYPVIYIIFGKQYLDCIPVFRLLALNYLISGTFRIISGNLLVTQRCLKFNFLVAIISGIANVICDYFFITWWGAVGAALATIVVVLISSIMSTAYLIRQFCRKANTNEV